MSAREEERYFAETGIFPVMHVVVLRRDVYEQRPWLAQSLFKAFERARRDAAARVAETAALRLAAAVGVRRGGADPAPDGRRLLDATGWRGTPRRWGRSSGTRCEQGLIKRQRPVEELFAAETREEYVI